MSCRAILLLVALTSAASAPGAGAASPEASSVQGRPRRAEAQETVTKRFAIGPEGSVDLTNFSGDIKVTGDAGAEVRLEAVKRVRAPQGDTRPLLESIVIDTAESAGRLEVRTLFRKSRGVHAAVDYTVLVPAGTAVAVRSLAGDITVAGVKGDVQLETANGTIVASRTPRLLRVKTLSGDIRLDEAASPRTLSASTISGTIVARGIETRALEVVSVSGDLSVNGANCERAELRTVNGDVFFAGRLAKGGRYEFNTHSGDVELGLGGKTGFQLTARTFSGEVRSDLALKLLTDPDADRLPPGVPRKQDVKGTFGDGSAQLLVTTFSGDVAVKRVH